MNQNNELPAKIFPTDTVVIGPCRLKDGIIGLAVVVPKREIFLSARAGSLIADLAREKSPRYAAAVLIALYRKTASAWTENAIYWASYGEEIISDADELVVSDLPAISGVDLAWHLGMNYLERPWRACRPQTLGGE